MNSRGVSCFLVRSSDFLGFLGFLLDTSELDVDVDVASRAPTSFSTERPSGGRWDVVSKRWLDAQDTGA